MVEVTEPKVVKFWDDDNVTNTFVIKSGWSNSYHIITEFGDRDDFEHSFKTFTELPSIIGNSNTQKVRELIG